MPLSSFSLAAVATVAWWGRRFRFRLPTNLSQVPKVRIPAGESHLLVDLSGYVLWMIRDMFREEAESMTVSVGGAV
jgi:hypothetical protein